MFSVGIGKYTVHCDDQGLPEIYGDYKNRAKVAEEFNLHASEGALCFVAVQKDAEWPFLVIAQKYSPSGAGFHPGVHLVEETGIVFIGAGERLLSYSLHPCKRLWEDVADVGFWSWTRHGGVVVMSAELELAAWDIEGRKLWSTSVEPPWHYTVVKDRMLLDVMGNKATFNLRQGPLPGR